MLAGRAGGGESLATAHGRGDRMQTFDQHLLELFQRKKISFEVAKMAASNAEEFQRSLTIE